VSREPRRDVVEETVTETETNAEKEED
jgi:hypothetical protein